jgi:hypothetical protein
MRTHHGERVLTFGDFMVAVYIGCGKRKARAMVRLAANARVVNVRGHRRFVFSGEDVRHRASFALPA